MKAEYLLYGTSDSGMDPNEEIAGSGDFAPKPAATLFDPPDILESKPEPKPMRQVKRERTERKIEKIVVFYDDKTFREYDPE